MHVVSRAVLVSTDLSRDDGTGAEGVSFCRFCGLPSCGNEALLARAVFRPSLLINGNL